MDGRHPALARLDVFVGRWTLRVKAEGLGPAWTEFAWREDGKFLRQYADAEPASQTAPQGWRDNAPFPTTALIGLDDTTGEFTMLYADARGVHRVYRMTFEDNVLRIWRDAPGFNQRFTATVRPDGDSIDGRWEMSQDGATWHLDFELTYTRDSGAR
jgi:hypothetical protein